MARASPAAQAANGIRLYFLGRLRIERDTRPIRLPRRKVESLLAYLVLRPEAHAREQLAALFWGGSPDAQARHSLRTALGALRKGLGALRKGLGAEFLLADREAVQLNPAFPAWVDALEFQTQAAAVLADPSPEPIALNVELYRGDLLSDLYDDWIQPEREHYRALYLDTLLRLAGQMRSRGEYERAVEFAGRVVAADRANERAHQHLMFCYAALGNRSAAARQYEECRRALLEDLGVEPAPETAAIYESIKQVPSGVTSTDSPRTNLPHSLTSFIGRRREMTEVKALLSETRLFTITGAGGSGKTRLAIQVATELADGFEDGAWLVELAGLTDPALVVQALAAVVGARETPYQPLSETLVSTLRSKQTLIVLDNCEHVIHACAQLSDLLLSACPRLQILATSREALGITGEVAWQVPTLSLPEPRQALPIQSLLQFEAIRLFAERAQAVNQGFTLTEQSAPAVQEVCQRLDGIPLAIELAAARVKMLSVEQIAARLDDRFNLLTTGSRTALPRHQTLRAMIDWSHDLLAEKERAMFRRLSVFAGGFALAGATAVCAGDGIEENEALDLLSHLVDKSLVIVEADQRSGQPRYRLLDTIRQYAGDRLSEAREAEPARSRHAQYFLYGQ